jgi:hypothetical protein
LLCELLNHYFEFVQKAVFQLLGEYKKLDFHQVKGIFRQGIGAMQNIDTLNPFMPIAHHELDWYNEDILYDFGISENIILNHKINFNERIIKWKKSFGPWASLHEASILNLKVLDANKIECDKSESFGALRLLWEWSRSDDKINCTIDANYHQDLDPIQSDWISVKRLSVFNKIRHLESIHISWLISGAWSNLENARRFLSLLQTMCDENDNNYADTSQ